MSIQNKFSFQSKWDVPLSVSAEQLRENIEQLKTLEVSSEGIMDVVSDFFDRAFNTLRLASQSVFGDDKKTLHLDTGRLNRLDKTKMSRGYASMMDNDVSIPPGMCVDYDTYTKQMFNVTKVLKDVISQVVQLRIDIGRVISNDKGLTDSTLFSDLSYIRQSDVIAKELKQLSAMRKPDDFNAKAKYGDVFNSGIDIWAVVKTAENSNDLINTIDRKKLQMEIDSTVQYIQDLHSKSSEGYSKPLIAKIGNAVTRVAEIVEAFSVTVYSAEVLCTALNSAIAEAEAFSK